MSFFQNSVLNKHLKTQDETTVLAAFEKFKAYFQNPEIQQNIREAKEEQFQEGFLRELFVNILGYTLNPQPNFNLTTELKNEKGAKKCDGAILQDSKALGVIELKGTNTKDLDKINAQAFNYKNNQTGCVYVITSNFEKLRFFIHHSVDHLEFNLFTLTESEFKLLWLCLSAENLLKGIPLKVKEESLLEEEKITKQLYKDYAAFRTDLWQNMVKNNAAQDKLLLFKKTQKLLDRFLFIFFAEDSGLLPPNSISRIVKRWTILKEEDAYKPLYEIFQQYFGYINKGRKGQKTIDDIFAYNGGLFKPDEILDNINLDDETIHPHVLKLTNYDFQSEVDVNILGHIFENSLNEIENITAELEGQEIDKSKNKRKKDGVFYTPKYITKYIVDNSVGKLCDEQKAELSIVDEEYAKGRKNRKKDTIKQLDKNLQAYRNWLLNITICDPACGSGAFLNQALEFLMEEHAYIDELESQLLGHAFEFPGVENHILEKNIFGVDINEESVDIAKLSLWLRTAQRGRKLTTLNNNIKCGNSLIDDKVIAGDKAFNWKNEFPNVFEKGGFDVIIGNPPYVLCQPSNTPEYLLNSYKEYEVASYKIDLFHLFFERGINILMEKGTLGFITPNTYLTNKYIQPLRNYILKKSDICNVVTHEEAVFADASVDVATIIFQKQKTDNNNIVLLESKNNMIYEVGNKKQIEWENESNNIFNVRTGFEINTEKTLQLGDICKTYFGIQAYDRKSSISEEKLDDKYIEVIDGGDIFPYIYSKPTKYFNYKEENIKSGGDWNVYNQERIVIRQIGHTPIVGMCKTGILGSNTLYSVFPKDENYNLKYLLCILNSKMLKQHWITKYSDGKQLFPKIKGYQLKELPIAKANSDTQSSFIQKSNERIENTEAFQNTIDFFIGFVKNKIPNLNSKLSNWFEQDFTHFANELKKSKIVLNFSEEAEWMQYFNEQQEKAQTLKAAIDKTDAEIDAMVYELYGVSEEEIKIVENN